MAYMISIEPTLLICNGYLHDMLSFICGSFVSILGNFYGHNLSGVPVTVYSNVVAMLQQRS